MTTLALQRQVQRHRFAQHALAAIANRLPRPVRSLLTRSAPAPASLTAAEVASQQAQEVREMARAYQRTDPGFASDLFAAAARHEGLNAD